MPKITIHKTRDYTIMSNYHFKEKQMSLKAKGLLSQMLSLPTNWDYSISGLVALNKENETSIKSTLNELKKFNYLKVTKIMPDKSGNGRIKYEYDIYEIPFEKQGVENQGVENLGVEFLGVENQGQYNINNKYTNNKINIYSNKTKKYGEYNRIKLTDEQYKKLCEDFGKNFIDKQIMLLDEYVESNNNKNKYSNFNIVLRKSIRENWFNSNKEILPEWIDKNVESLTNEQEQDELNNLLKDFK